MLRQWKKLHDTVAVALKPQLVVVSVAVVLHNLNKDDPKKCNAYQTFFGNSKKIIILGYKENQKRNTYVYGLLFLLHKLVHNYTPPLYNKTYFHV